MQNFAAIDIIEKLNKDWFLVARFSPALKVSYPGDKCATSGSAASN
jgi:hypothetical protein